MPPARECGNPTVSSPYPTLLGGKKIGEGARDGVVEWIFRVRIGPRKGLVEGVNAISEEVVVRTTDDE